jgi:methylglutaconyl-CoA hydratase
MEAYVKTETYEGITTIEFFHPQSNSLPRKILQDLADNISGAANKQDTKIIVLQSAGEKAFCAGASFTELQSITNEQQGFDFFSGFAEVINAMRRCSKLIIGRIHGKCVGGGVGLAAAVDYAIATKGADVRLSELAVGIGPFVVGPAIERKIGVSAFSQLAIDATTWRDAEWAKSAGLYAEVHSTVQQLDEAVNRLAVQLAKSNTDAIAELKKIFWKGTDDWDQLLKSRAEISGRLVLSEFTKNAIQAFKSKA